MIGIDGKRESMMSVWLDDHDIFIYMSIPNKQHTNCLLKKNYSVKNLKYLYLNLLFILVVSYTILGWFKEFLLKVINTWNL